MGHPLPPIIMALAVSLHVAAPSALPHDVPFWTDDYGYCEKVRFRQGCRATGMLTSAAAPRRPFARSRDLLRVCTGRMALHP